MYAPFTIADVSDLLRIERLRSRSDESSFPVVCPYCRDTRGKMNFCVSKDGEIKNTYHCFHCGAGGNMLQLYADMQGITGADRCKIAYWEIQDRLNRESDGNAMKRSRKKRDAVPSWEHSGCRQADDTQKDKVYRAVLSELTLSSRHKIDLRRRGLTEEGIRCMEDMGFRSTDREKAGRIARKLLLKGYHLEGVPGFYMDHAGDWRIAFERYNRGYLCPVYSVAGLILGFQIRMDEPFHGMKYVWLTSSGKKKGCSSKSPVGFYGNPDDRKIYVTEGILKAAAANLVTGRSFIGNPGVSHYKELKHTLVELKKRGLQCVFECYDMDKMMRIECTFDQGDACRNCSGAVESGICPKKEIKRDDIRAGCNRLYRICEELALNVVRVTWDLDADGFWRGDMKGIDDWQMNEMIQMVRKQTA